MVRGTVLCSHLICSNTASTYEAKREHDRLIVKNLNTTTSMNVISDIVAPLDNAEHEFGRRFTL